jgi:hypothetical protein
MGYTILRPVAFFDNFTPDFMGKGFAAMWAGVDPKPLQLVSVHDIGVFAARAFISPEQYKGRSIGLAGDELTFAQAKKVFKGTLGYDMPTTFGFVGGLVKFAVKELRVMFDWFKNDGYGCDIKALREEEPELQDLAKWLKESSKFEK